MKFVIVGFRVEQEKSVYYAKAKDLKELARKTVLAFVEKDAHFVSIRGIPEEAEPK